MEELEKQRLGDILACYKGSRSELIPILLKVQAEFYYLPEEAIQQIASLLCISEGEIYSLASFYSHFRLKPVGRQVVTVCRGTACHIHGAPQILGGIEKIIGIEEGETRTDLEYTLETVACIGCCALAPCIKINNEVHGEMTLKKTEELFLNLKKREPDA